MRHSNVSDWFVVENLRRNTISHLLPLVLRFAGDERLLCVSRDLSFWCYEVLTIPRKIELRHLVNAHETFLWVTASISIRGLPPHVAMLHRKWQRTLPIGKWGVVDHSWQMSGCVRTCSLVTERKLAWNYTMMGVMWYGCKWVSLRSTCWILALLVSNDDLRSMGLFCVVEDVSTFSSIWAFRVEYHWFFCCLLSLLLA